MTEQEPFSIDEICDLIILSKGFLPEGSNISYDHELKEIANKERKLLKIPFSNITIDTYFGDPKNNRNDKTTLDIKADKDKEYVFIETGQEGISIYLSNNNNIRQSIRSNNINMTMDDTNGKMIISSQGLYFSINTPASARPQTIELYEKLIGEKAEEEFLKTIAQKFGIINQEENYKDGRVFLTGSTEGNELIIKMRKTHKDGFHMIVEPSDDYQRKIGYEIIDLVVREKKFNPIGRFEELERFKEFITEKHIMDLTPQKINQTYQEFMRIKNEKPYKT